MFITTVARTVPPLAIEFGERLPLTSMFGADWALSSGRKLTMLTGNTAGITRSSASKAEVRGRTELNLERDSGAARTPAASKLKTRKAKNNIRLFMQVSESSFRYC